MKTFEISYKRNDVYQAILINAETAETAVAYFNEYKPDAEVIGYGEHTGCKKPGMPERTVPEGWEPEPEEIDEEAAQPVRTAEDENRSHCKHIAQELDAYANGEVYTCPDCGEILHLPDDVGDRYRCPHCEAVNDVNNLEQLGIWDFLSDVFDVEYRCGSNREYRSVRVMVACGGPNIYLDSASKDVELYWWNERSRYPMSYEAAEALDQWAEDYWNM